MHDVKSLLNYKLYTIGQNSLVNQTTPSAALGVLHHQHTGGRVVIQHCGGSGLVQETMDRSGEGAYCLFCKFNVVGGGRDTCTIL